MGRHVFFSVKQEMVPLLGDVSVSVLTLIQSLPIGEGVGNLACTRLAVGGFGFPLPPLFMACRAFHQILVDRFSCCVDKFFSFQIHERVLYFQVDEVSQYRESGYNTNFSRAAFFQHWVRIGTGACMRRLMWGWPKGTQ